MKDMNSKLISSLVFFLMIFFSGIFLSESMTFSNIFFLWEFLSASLFWLSLGGICLSYLSENNKQSFVWWSMSFLLFFSFLSSNFLLFYMFFELSVIPILLLILFNGNQPERISAGMMFLTYMIVFSVPFLLVLVIFLPNGQFLKNSFFFSNVFFSMFLLMPFLVKMPVFGLHFWLPKAHVEASTSGSMILAGLLLKLGSYGVTRIHLFFYLFYQELLLIWTFLTLTSSIITVLQTDIKKLVAYSSITHMTFLCLGLLSDSSFLMFSTILISLSHGWTSMGLFFLMGSSSNMMQSRLGYFFSTESMLNWSMILSGSLFLSNSSIPPLPSFFSEMKLVCLSCSVSFVNTLILMIFISIFICYYNMFLFLLMLHVKPSLVSSSMKMRFNNNLSIFILLLILSLGWLQTV